MSKTIRQHAEDWIGLWLVALIGGSVFTFRKLAIMPLTAGLCAAANAPVFCVSRAAMLWLQYQQAFGWAALLCGSAGLALGQRWPGVLAVAVGIAAVANCNVVTGVIGVILGLIAGVGLLTRRYKKEGSFL